jgi:hypothetical protein
MSEPKYTYMEIELLKTLITQLKSKPSKLF